MVLQEKSQSGEKKLNPTQLVCGFVASWCVWIFAVAADNTVNIPEVFQVLTVFLVTL